MTPTLDEMERVARADNHTLFGDPHRRFSDPTRNHGFECRTCAMLALIARLRLAEKALSGINPFSGGRDGDMCLWCSRDARSFDTWEERFDPKNHNADCEFIAVLAAYRKEEE